MPCATCAFRAGTDNWQGFDKTMVNFIGAMELGEAFYCHEGMRIVNGEYRPPMRRLPGVAKKVPDTRRMTPCAAWVVLASNPPLKIADHVPLALRVLCVALVKRGNRN